ncbi:MAG: chemotaxis-specific protein-glutamate methyltransferase CheB [Thermodesulfobacteriota bacterium]
MIRVVVVDDSEAVRKLLTYILNGDPEIQVVGTASDGEEAVRVVERLRPDVVTMDVVMPRMDGYEATRRIMRSTPVPIVVVSASYSTEEVSRTFQAMGSGALTAVDKPMGPGDPLHEQRARELLAMVKLMSEVKVVGRRYPVRPTASAPAMSAWNQTPPIHAVAVGASTGGPQVLELILRTLPNAFRLPVLLVQHIAEGFAHGLADWLQGATSLEVRVAAHDENLAPGRCYVAPSGRHMGVSRARRIVLNTAPPENGLRPSIDFLFRSVAASLGRNAAGVLLTGMGRDGAEGLKAMRDQGALTVAQDEETAVIPGMPREAVQIGAARLVLSPDQIAAWLLELNERAENRVNNHG